MSIDFLPPPTTDPVAEGRKGAKWKVQSGKWLRHKTWRYTSLTEVFSPTFMAPRHA